MVPISWIALFSGVIFSYLSLCRSRRGESLAIQLLLLLSAAPDLKLRLRMLDTYRVVRWDRTR